MDDAYERSYRAQPMFSTEPDDIGLPKVKAPTRLRLGYIALLDVLGFKGIWQQHDVQLVLQKMERVQQAGKVQEWQYNRDFLKVSGGKPTCTVNFLSDTIVVGTQFGSDEPDFAPDESSRRFLLSWILFIVRQVLVEWVEGWPNRNLRGCITYGKYVSQYPFFVGEAIDEAADMYEQAEGAFIWASPAVKDLLGHDDCDVIDISGNRLVRYDVPLKQRTVRTWAIDIGQPTKHLDRRQMQEAVMSGFDTPYSSTRPDVQAKRRNTIEFLQRCADFDPNEHKSD